MRIQLPAAAAATLIFILSFSSCFACIHPPPAPQPSPTQPDQTGAQLISPSLLFLISLLNLPSSFFLSTLISFSSCLLSLPSLSHLCLFPLFLLFLCACLSSFSFPDLAVVSQTECGSTVGGDRMIRSAALTPRRRARKSSFV